MPDRGAPRSASRGAIAPPLVRRLEIATAWVAVAVAWCAGVLGEIGPRLGGSEPGLEGPLGFVSETVAAMWIPIGLLATISAVAAGIRRLWWPAAALTPVVLIILAPDLWARILPPAGLAPLGRPAVRLATVNLAAQNDEDPLMERSLRELDADVLVLPEFTSSWAEQLEAWFSADYPHRWLAAAVGGPGYSVEGLRLAIWSRLPPAGDPEVLHLGGINAQLRIPLRWRGRAFALYGIHPRKPYPFQLYAGAWHDRRHLLDWVRSEPLPAVVAGDFNAPPRSAFLSRLRQLGWTNASEAVLGYAPATWPTDPDAFPPIRIAIDHVMLSDAFTAVGFRTGITTRSDHAPVVAELVWRDG